MNGKPFIRRSFSESTIINHFIALVGAGCLVISYFETKDIFYLTKNGIRAEGTIYLVDETVSSTSHSGDIYYHFSFFIHDTLYFGDGSTYHIPKMCHGRLLHLKGKKLEEGSKIAILYDPLNFEKYIFDLPLKKHLAQVRVWGLIAMGALMLLYGELNIFWQIHKNQL